MESSSSSFTLVLSHMQSNLNLISNYKSMQKRGKNQQYTLYDGTIIQMMERGALTASYCAPSQVYLKVVNPSILALNAIIDGLNIYSDNNRNESETDAKYTLNDLKNGITLESESSMQRILKKILAKKRLKFLKVIIKLYCRYRRFLRKYYAPGGCGYEIAKKHFEILSTGYFKIKDQTW